MSTKTAHSQKSFRIRHTSAKAIVKAVALLYDVDAIDYQELCTVKATLNELVKKGEMPQAPEKRLLDSHQVAALLAIGESTLKRGLAENTISLPKVRIGGAVRFRYEDVVKLIDSVEPDPPQEVSTMSS